MNIPNTRPPLLPTPGEPQGGTVTASGAPHMYSWGNPALRDRATTYTRGVTRPKGANPFPSALATHPSTGPANSQNPDFGKLWKGFFRGVQLEHHLQNWSNIPSSISSKLGELVEFLTPPNPNPKIKNTLSNIIKDTGNLIKDQIKNHIMECIKENKNELGGLNPKDKSRAALIAEKHLKRRLGKRISDSFLKTNITTLLECTRDDTPLPTGGDSIPHADSQATGDPNAMEWTLVRGKPKNKKRTQSDSTSPTFETSNTKHTNSGTDILDEFFCLGDGETPSRRPVPLLKRSRATLTGHPTSVKQSTRGAVNTYDIGSLPGTVHTVIVSDSNFRPIEDDRIPEGWHLSINPGLKLQEAISLLKRRDTAPNAKRIIIAVGINDRNQDLNLMKATLMDLTSTIEHRREGGHISFSAKFLSALANWIQIQLPICNRLTIWRL